MHRDIKPANLLLDGEGKLWITDFGLARIEADAGMTMTGDVLGTLRYMSPEQALGRRAVVDHRSDVYSLGATLYELLTLRPALEGDDRQEMLRNIATEPLAPRRLNPAIPHDLDTIVLKSMSQEPAERYADAEQLAADLRRFLEDRPIHARRPTLAQRTKKWALRHRPLMWSLAGGLALAVVALAVSTVLVMRAHRDVEAAYDREKVERQKAEDRLRLAIEATNQIYLKFTVDHHSFFGSRNGPAEPLSAEDRQLLQKIVRFYEQLAVAESGEPSHRREVVEAWLRIANLRNTLKMHQQAMAACTQAVEIAQRLVSEFPHVPDYKKALAEAHEGRAYSYFAMGDWDRAMADVDEAIRLVPDDAEMVANRGSLHSKQGNLPGCPAARCRPGRRTGRPGRQAVPLR
ncbi:MAG: protein kinase [Planctomycetes bacterium]|nr:protein kinase [Planctomycetota bacterium]